jgi:hypothetical protein
MKNILILILFVFSQAVVVAQAPQALNYQAVARKQDGSISSNQPVSIRFSVLDGSAAGTVIYQETHQTSTNNFGLFTLAIGTGTTLSGNFSAINWGAGLKFLKVEIALQGGANYQLQGVSQLLSVPYALYAERSNTPGPQGPAGATGPAGPQGFPGQKSLIDLVNFSSNANCTTGGIIVKSGVDQNNNNVLDANEVDNIKSICFQQSPMELPKTFTALLSQTGGSAPVATIISNSLNLSITWSRISQGRYRGILNQNLDMTKTILLNNNSHVHCRLNSSNEILVDNACGINAYCDDFSRLSLEIKVYQ